MILLGEKLIDVVHSWELFPFQSAQPANIDMIFPKEDVCTSSVLCVNTNSAAVATILFSITMDRYFLTCCVHALSKLIRLIRHFLNHTFAYNTTTEISLSPMNVFYLLNRECVFVISKGCV